MSIEEAIDVVKQAVQVSSNMRGIMMEASGNLSAQTRRRGRIATPMWAAIPKRSPTPADMTGGVRW